MRRLLISILCLISFPAYATTGAAGTSLLGVYTTDNVPALTFGYQDQFGNTNGGSIIFRGSTSGTTTLKPNATAGTSVLTMPTESADTLVDLTGTQTLTNKTLTAPTLANATLTLPAINGVVTQGEVFSSVQSANPVMMLFASSIPVASINTSSFILQSVSGRTIYPSGIMVTAIGSTAGNTRVIIECGSGNILASIPLNALVSGSPNNSLSSAGGVFASSGTAYTGCAVSDGILISNVGSSITGATALFVNMPYTVQ